MIQATIAEQWKEIKDYPGYWVSDRGRVRRTKHGITRILAASDNGTCNLYVTLNNNSAKNYRAPVHRLVYAAFVEPIPRDKTICFLDGNRRNFAPSNLVSLTAPRVIDLTGRVFRYLTVVKFSRLNHRKNSMWICRCVCGNEKLVSALNLVHGHTSSCGCKRREMVASKISGSRNHLWKGGIKNHGSLAWCKAKLSSLRCTTKQYRSEVNINGTPEDVQKLWTECGGQCVVCGRSNAPLCLDHDNATGKLRGFLCSQCNVALGMAGESPDRLRQLAEYLESTQ